MPNSKYCKMTNESIKQECEQIKQARILLKQKRKEINNEIHRLTQKITYIQVFLRARYKSQYNGESYINSYCKRVYGKTRPELNKEEKLEYYRAMAEERGRKLNEQKTSKKE